MTFSKYQLVARGFFDLADRVQDMMDSDVGQQIETFDDDDFGTVVSTLLDAGYWISSGELGSDLEEDPMGHNLYVSMNVYNDLLYRGFAPLWAWEASGLSDLFADTPLNAPSLTGVPIPPPKTSSVLKNGDYVFYKVEEGVRGGMVSSGRILSFAGNMEEMTEGAIVTSREEALEYMGKYAKQISDEQKRRVDG